MGPPRSLPPKVTCRGGVPGPWAWLGGALEGSQPLTESQPPIPLPLSALVLAWLWTKLPGPHGLSSGAAMKVQPQNASPFITSSRHKIHTAGPTATPWSCLCPCSNVNALSPPGRQETALSLTPLGSLWSSAVLPEQCQGQATEPAPGAELTRQSIGTYQALTVWLTYYELDWSGGIGQWGQSNYRKIWQML